MGHVGNISKGGQGEVLLSTPFKKKHNNTKIKNKKQIAKWIGSPVVTQCQCPSLLLAVKAPQRIH